jgi:hypothetical protein
MGKDKLSAIQWILGNGGAFLENYGFFKSNFKLFFCLEYHDRNGKVMISKNVGKRLENIRTSSIICPNFVLIFDE